MKKNLLTKIGFFLIMLVTVFAFAACGDDDDDDGGATITESELVGTWNMNSVIVNGTNQSLYSTSYITFNSDHTYHLVFLDYDYVGTWTLKGNTITGVTPDPITEIMRVTSRNGNTVHIAYSNSEGTKMELECTKR